MLIEIFAALIPLGWLMPNHYSPWLSAWSDGATMAILMLLVLSLTVKFAAHAQVSRPLLALVILCVLTPCAQFAFGKIFYVGDVAVVILYVGMWLLAILAGSLLVKVNDGGDGVNWLAAGWALAAIMSVAIAFSQWTGSIDFGFYSVDLPPGKRPFANVAQPNQFNTLCFFGLCGLLVLHQTQRINKYIFWFSAVLVLCGMVLSQSRTGWIQIFFLILWGGLSKWRIELRFRKIELFALAAVFLIGTFTLTAISDALMLSVERTLDGQLEMGLRASYWEAMLNALRHEPLWGYGWQQVGAAQLKVALDQKALGIYFAHSHNLILDLLLWNGIPLGILMSVLAGWWLVQRANSCLNPIAIWLMAAIGGFFIHGMLEFPHEYAYFLIPAGLAMGAADGLWTSQQHLLRVSRGLVLCLLSTLSLLFSVIAVDYFSAEENYRTQQLELARIGVSELVTPVPKLYLLTQLSELLNTAHVDVNSSMTAAELERLRKVSVRFGYPATFQRYVEGLALNGNPEEAKQQMLILKSMWGDKIYTHIKNDIRERAKSKYPALDSLQLP